MAEPTAPDTEDRATGSAAARALPTRHLVDLPPPHASAFDTYATAERRARLEQLAWDQLGAHAHPLLSLHIAEEILRATWRYPRVQQNDDDIDKCLSTLTRLRTWQYRMWMTLGRPTAVQFVDAVRAYSAKRPRLKLVDSGDDAHSSSSSHPTSTAPDVIDWTEGRRLAKGAVRCLEHLVPPAEWDAYEMVWYFGRDYDLIGTQLGMPATLVEEYCSRVMAVIESWLSPAEYFAELKAPEPAPADR